MALLQYRGLRRRRGKAKATGRAKGDELRRVASEPQWSMGLATTASVLTVAAAAAVSYNILSSLLLLTLRLLPLLLLMLLLLLLLLVLLFRLRLLYGQCRLALSGASWGVVLGLRGRLSVERYVGLFCARIHDLPPGATAVNATHRMHLAGRGSEKMEQRCEKAHIFLPRHDDSGSLTAMADKIADLEKPSFLVDDTLVIGLEVTAWGTSQKRKWQLPLAPGPAGRVVDGGAGDQTRAALAGNSVALLASGQAADVEVRGALSEAGEQAVKAHRLVLAARSPVFNRTMLESGTRESQAGAGLSLEGVGRATMEHFVRVQYTGGFSQESLDDRSSLCHLLCLGPVSHVLLRSFQPPAVATRAQKLPIQPIGLRGILLRMLSTMKHEARPPPPPPPRPPLFSSSLLLLLPPPPPSLQSCARGTA